MKKRFPKIGTVLVTLAAILPAAFSLPVYASTILEHGCATSCVGQNVGDHASTNRRTAESFVATGTASILTVWLDEQGTPTFDVILSIQGDNSGEPNGTDLGYCTITAATITGGGFAEYSCTMDTTVDLGGTKKYLVVRPGSAGDAANYYKTHYDATAGGYASGGFLYSDTSLNWTSAENDLIHRFRIETAAPTPTPTPTSTSEFVPLSQLAGSVTGTNLLVAREIRYLRESIWLMFCLVTFLGILYRFGIAKRTVKANA